ncbi:hypothetical protein FSARC_14383 [Fusarium sarcochroum]|uniref:Uncharacterized protein n=1 Tax=Fusarium sarcochroum TaxID=1208366 RepID=A0A8H4SUB5_9HYPO|nr:hypothetical protein FSARC_14383 [Fusarium sarcochroum]
MAASLISTWAPIGQWVDALFNRLFDNPDDQASATIFQKFISPNLVYRINHDRHDFLGFDTMLKEARRTTIMQTKSNNEVQSWEAPDGSGGGCVAHMSHFSLIDKAGADAIECSALTLSTVKVQDGQRTLFELAEIHQVVS